MKGKNFSRRVYALLMALFMVMSMLPQTTLTTKAEEEQVVETTDLPEVLKDGEEPEDENTEQQEEQEETEETYTIRYVANGGEGEMDFQEFSSKNENISLKKNEYIKDGYQFAGWSTTADNDDVIIQGDIDMEAIFVPDETKLNEFTFEYDENEDGEISDEEKFDLFGCVRENKLVLYAQWEENTPEESADKQETKNDNNEDADSGENPDIAAFDFPDSVDITSKDLQTLVDAPQISSEEMMKLRNNVPIILDEENKEVDTAQAEGDGSKIDRVSVSWIGEDGTELKTVDLRDKDNSEFSVRMRVDMVLSGKNNYPTGSVQIRIPKAIMHDRNKVLVGEMSLSVPEDPDKRATFAYTDMEDYYLLTNTRSLPASTAAYFEFTISKMVPNTIPSDMESEPFNAIVSVDTPKGFTLTNTSNDIRFRILTEEKLESVTKRCESVHLDWPNAWNDEDINIPKPKKIDKDGNIATDEDGQPLDDNPKNYIFVDWYMYVDLDGNQNYDLSFSDDFGKMRDNNGEQVNIQNGYQVLAYRYDNMTVPWDGTRSIQIAENEYQGRGNRYYTHVYVAYNRENFPLLEDKNTRVVYEVMNTVNYKLTGTDDRKEQTKSATATAEIAFVPFYVPDGQFNVWKSGNDGDSRDVFYAPDSYLESINYYGFGLNELLREGYTDLSYDVELAGFGYKLTYGEKDENGNALDPSDPASYGKKSYSFEISDDRLYWDDKNNIKNYHADSSKLLSSENYQFKSLLIGTPTVLEYVRYETNGNGYTYDSSGGVKWQAIAAGEYGFRKSEDKTNYPDIKILGKLRSDDQEWTEMGIYSFSGNHQTTKYCQIENNVVTFTEPVAAYQIVVSTNRAGILQHIYPTVRLKKTEYVEKYIEKKMSESDNASIPLSNVLSFKIKDNEGQVRLSYGKTETLEDNPDTLVAGKKGTDVLQGINLSADASQSLKDIRNDTSNMEVELDYKLNVSLQTNLGRRETYLQAINNGYLTQETEGTFYDLLPAHVVPDLDTIKLRQGDEIVSVQTIENYKGSGRTMLIVKAKLVPVLDYYAAYDSDLGYPGCGEKLQMTFSARISWVDLIDHGRKLENNFVYKSSNDQLGTVAGYIGEPDQPGYGNHKNSLNGAGTAVEYLTHINGENEPNSYLYAKSVNDINVNLSGLTSLSKYVSVNGDGRYTMGQVTGKDTAKAYVGGLYTYRIRMESLKGTVSKGIILFDKLETFEPNDTMGQEYVDELKEFGTWKGHFHSIDTSDVEAIGVKPVVYYSDNADLNLDEQPNRDFTNTSIWKKLDSATNKNDVKIIAVDLSKMQDGSEFQLKEKEAANVYVNMLAPAADELKNITLYKKSLTGEEVAGSHAYNAVNMAADIKAEEPNAPLPGGITPDEIGEFQSIYLPYQFTRLAIAPLDIKVQKEWNDNDNQDGYRPKKIQLQLLANGEAIRDSEGKELYLAELSEENGWKTLFEKVPPTDANGKPYYYSFKETTVDAEDEGKLNNYSLAWTSTSGTRQVEELDQNGNKVTYEVETKDYTLTNLHKPEVVSVSGTKIWDDNNNYEGKRPQEVTISLYQKVGEESKFTKVTSVRTNAARDWKYSFPSLPKYQSGKKIIYEVREDEYYPGYRWKTEGFNIINTYDPYGDLSVQKTVVNGTPKAIEQDFEFTATFYTKDENENIKILPDRFEADKYRMTESGDQKLNDKPIIVSTGTNFSLKHNEKLVIHHIHSETLYRIEEAEKPGFTKISETNSSGSISALDTNLVTFTNDYQATGKINLKAKKVVENHSLYPRQFRFTVSDTEKKEDDYSILRTASNDKDGNIIFGAFNYTTDDLNADGTGTKTYLLQEIEGENKGYTYSSDSYLATVTLTDNGDGTISTGVTYQKQTDPEVNIEISEDVPTFTNVYKAEGTAEIKAWKKLTGRSLSSGEFSFNLYKYEEVIDEQGNSTFIPVNQDENGSPLPSETETNAQDGGVNFSPVSYRGVDTTSPLYFTEKDAGKTFRFKVTEQEGSDQDIIYNTDSLVYEIHVIDDDNGHLSYERKFIGVERTIKDENGKDTEKTELDTSVTIPVIENSLKNGGLKIKKSVPMDSPDDLFKFKVKFDYPEGKDIGEDITIKPEPLNGSNFIVHAVSFDESPAANVHFDIYWVPDDNEHSWEQWVGYAETDETGYAGVYGVDKFDDSNGHFKAVISNWDNSIDYPSVKEYVFTDPVIQGNTKVYTWDLQMDESNKAYAILDKQAGVLTFYRGNEKEVQEIAWSYDHAYYHNDSYRYHYLVFPNVDEVYAGHENGAPWYKTYWSSYAGTIRRIECKGPKNAKRAIVRPKDLKYWFSGLYNVESIDLSMFDMSDTTSMKGMFKGCKSLKSVTFGSHDTRSVTDMNDMFNGCTKLESLDLSSFDTSSVTDMSNMFNECSSLTSLDLSSFNTSSVTNMSDMFNGCSSLTSLDLSSFDTSSVTSMSSMFSGCSGLTSLDLSSFDTSSVTNMSNIFNGCSSLTSLDLSSLDTSSVTSMWSMFRGCSSLTSLDLKPLDTSAVTSMDSMFSGCSSLTSLDLKPLDTSAVTSMNSMFRGCSSLTSLDLKPLDTSSVTNMWSIFSGCSSLTSLDLKPLDTSAVTSMDSMFSGCSSLMSLDLSPLDTSSVTNMWSMFSGCSSLTSLDLKPLDTSAVTSMDSMFSGCSSLTSLDLKPLDTSAVTSMDSMFNGCSSLTSLDLSPLDTSSVTNMRSMFSGCSSLTSLDLKPLDTSAVTSMDSMFSGCSSLTSLDLKPLDTSAVTSMDSMFNGCSKLESLDLSSFDTSSVTNMSNIFNGCSSLTSLDLSSLDTSSVTSMWSMFRGCSSLTSLDLKPLDTSAVTSMDSMFNGCSSLTSLDLSPLDTSSVTSMGSMFEGCSSLTSLDFSSLNIKAYMGRMFGYCSSLRRIVVNPDTFTYPENSGFEDPFIGCDNLIGGNGTRYKNDNGSYLYDSSTWLAWQQYFNVDIPDNPGLFTSVEQWNSIPHDQPEAVRKTAKISSAPASSELESLKMAKAVGLSKGNIVEKQEKTKVSEIQLNTLNTSNEHSEPERTSFNDTLQGNQLSEVSVKTDFKAVEATQISGEKAANTNVSAQNDTEDDTPVITGGNGEYEVSIHGNETVTIPDIPAGTKYSVYEETPEGWKLVSSSGTTGTIEPRTTSEATFRNEYAPGSASVIITAAKVLEGGTLTNGQFEFELYSVEDNTETLISTVRNDETGMIVFPQLLYQGSEKTGTFNYRIKEVNSGYGNIVYDSQAYDVTVEVKDEGGKLSAAIISNPVVFTNKMTGGGPSTARLTVSKTVIDSEGAYIDLINTDMDIPAFTVNVSADGVDHKLELSKKNNFSAYLDLPVGTYYQVTEIDIPEDYILVNTYGDSGILQSWGTYVSIYNRYTVTPPEASVILEAQKVLENGDLEDGQFNFELRDDKDDVVAATTNTADGKILFELPVFTTQGEWTYKAREVIDSESVPAIKYDESEKTVTVKTVMKDGALIAETQWKDNDSVFTNKMEDSTLTVSKTVLNGTSKTSDTEFAFLLKLNPIPKTDSIFYINENGETVPSFRNEEDLYEFTLKDKGSAVFTLGNGTEYEVSEVESSGFVSAADGEKGTIQSGTEAVAAFTNTYSATGTFTPTAVKKMLGRPLNEGEFEFILQNEEGEEIQTAPNEADGTIKFNPIEYYHTDLGESGERTYTYRMLERAATDTDVISDQSVATIKVTVTDQGKGDLKVEPKYFVGVTPIDSIVFTNRAAVQLPAAGLGGNALPYGIGAAALAASVYVLLDNRKKKSKK